MPMTPTMVPTSGMRPGMGQMYQYNGGAGYSALMEKLMGGKTPEQKMQLVNSLAKLGESVSGGEQGAAPAGSGKTGMVGLKRNMGR